MRRAAFEQAGGFDEALCGYEDDDLFVRFFRLGWDHVFVHRPLLRFRIHATSSSASARFLDSRLRCATKLASILPADSRMFRYYVSDAIAPRFFLTSLDDYVRACSARDWEAAQLALSSVNHFAALRRRSLRLRWKLHWIQRPHLFRRLIASTTACRIGSASSATRRSRCAEALARALTTHIGVDLPRQSSKTILRIR